MRLSSLCRHFEHRPLAVVNFGYHLFSHILGGFATDDHYSFCKSNPEILSHFFFDCTYSQTFWKKFELYFFCISKERNSLTLKDVIIDIVDSRRPLLNYLLLIAKLYLWDCRRTSMLPEIVGLKHKIKNKFEI